MGFHLLVQILSIIANHMKCCKLHWTDEKSTETPTLRLEQRTEEHKVHHLEKNTCARTQNKCTESMNMEFHFINFIKCVSQTLRAHERKGWVNVTHNSKSAKDSQNGGSPALFKRQVTEMFPPRESQFQWQFTSQTPPHKGGCNSKQHQWHVWIDDLAKKQCREPELNAKCQHTHFQSKNKR